MRLSKMLAQKSKLRSIAALVTFLSLFGGVTRAHAAVGESGWTIFKKTQAANTRGITSVESRFSSLQGMLYNPAVLGAKTQKELSFLSEAGFAGDSLGGLLYGHPVKDGMIAGGLMGYDAGTMELNWIENGELKTQNASAQRDLMGIFSYGKRLGSKLTAGGSLKAASSTIAQQKTAYALAADMGLSYSLSPDITLSAALQNLGTSSKFIEKANPLPASAYFGGGYTFKIKDYYLLSGAGMTYNFVDGTVSPEVGAEIRYNMVSMSVGYRFNKQESALQLGLGVTWKNMEFGYAYVPGIYLDTTHRLNMSYRFGGPSEAKKAVEVRPAPAPQKKAAVLPAPAKTAPKKVTSAPSSPRSQTLKNTR